MRLWMPLLMSGCTLALTKPTPCESDDDCIFFFGSDYSCNQSTGYCVDADTPSDVSMPDRCNAFPEDFLTDSTYADLPVIGALIDVKNRQGDVHAMSLAISEWEDEGTAALVLCDHGEGEGSDYSDTWTGEEATENMVNFLVYELDARLIVGPSYGDEAQIAYSAAGVPGDVLFISPTATDGSLKDLGGDAFSEYDTGSFWTLGSDEDHAKALVAYFDSVDPAYSNIGVLWDAREGGAAESPGTTLHETLKNALEDAPRGYDVEIAEWTDETVSVSGTVLGDFLSESGEKRKQAVFLLSHDPNLNLDWLKAIGDSSSEFKTSQTRIFLGPHALTTEFQSAAPQDIGIPLLGFGPGVDGDSPEFTTFNSNYGQIASRYVELDPTAPYVYDATMMAYYGVAWAKLTGSDELASTYGTGIKRLSDGLNQVSIDLIDTVLLNLESGDGVDISGASGPLDFDWTTEEMVLTTEIYELEKASKNKLLKAVCVADDCR